MTKQSTTFWDFSNQLYDMDGVAEICLYLQDEYDLDVNLILFCIWMAQYPSEPSDEAWEKILLFSRDWKNNVVQPLRNTRQWMKNYSDLQDSNSFGELREQIKLKELDAEKLQQETLQNCVTEVSKGKSEFSRDRANLLFAKLLNYCSLTLEGEIADKFNTILSAMD